MVMPKPNKTAMVRTKRQGQRKAATSQDRGARRWRPTPEEQQEKADGNVHLIEERRADGDFLAMMASVMTGTGAQRTAKQEARRIRL